MQLVLGVREGALGAESQFLGEFKINIYFFINNGTMFISIKKNFFKRRCKLL